MKNESGIHPSGHRLLVDPKDVEEVSKGGIIIAIGSGKDREQMAQIMGIVMEVGSTCWKDQAVGDWCKPGDMVMFGKYAGLTAMGKDEKQYRIINDLDVIAVLEEPEESLIERVM